MAAHLHNRDYLATEVLTAPPQKLRLMLIEAAIRYITRARTSWSEGRTEEGGELILRAQDVIGELLGALKPDASSELVRNVAALYVFVFRALVDAHVRRDAARLEDALRVLRIEAETWRMVCRQLAEDQAPAASSSPQGPEPAEVAAATSAVPQTLPPPSSGPAQTPSIPTPHVAAAHPQPSPRAAPFSAYDMPGATRFSATG
ncbi:MAG: flagellar export chaperone FliS [Pirellulales bacterium]|nr:flagellar export chaperone FliS [Pirellulales bacterium]